MKYSLAQIAGESERNCFLERIISDISSIHIIEMSNLSAFACIQGVLPV